MRKNMSQIKIGKISLRKLSIEEKTTGTPELTCPPSI
jgi:hypothetical protein